MKNVTRIICTTIFLNLFALCAFSQGTITGAGTYSATTIGAGDDCGLRIGNDYTYTFTPAISGSWTFSLCTSSPTWDSYIYIRSGAGACGASTVTFNDDGCAPLSTVSAVLTSGTPYVIVIEGFGLSDQGAFTLVVTAPAVPVGIDCSSPAIVNSYPYSSSSTTCGAGNDYGIQCSGNYGGGEDYVYQLNITTIGTYTINVTATGGGSYIGWFLKSSADCATGSSCLANATSSSGTVANGTYNFTSAGTYYLIIDTWPSPTCSAYTINISAPVPPPANDNCAGATNLTPTPGVYTSPGTQSSANATSSGVTIPTCSFLTSSSALDVWYAFTTDPSGGNATATVVGSGGFDAVVQCLSGTCGSLVPVSCVDGTGSGTESLVLTGLAASTTYFLRVYGWAGSTGTFTISVAGTALPLELASFTGKTTPTSNMLLWETLTEKNVQSHIVERSVDGVKWMEVGRKAGQMESYAAVKYELEDRAPLAKAYYRLRSVDFDGAENLSSTVILIRKGEHFGITAAFPSPTKDQVTVQFESLTEENVTIRVMDFSGRLVLVQEYAADNGINEAVLQLDGLQAGVYLVRISNATATAEPMRIVKE